MTQIKGKITVVGLNKSNLFVESLLVKYLLIMWLIR